MASKSVIAELVDAKAWMTFVRTEYHLGRATLDEFGDADEALVRAELRWGFWMGRRDIVDLAQAKLDEIQHADEIVEGVLAAVGDHMAIKAREQFRVV